MAAKSKKRGSTKQTRQTKKTTRTRQTTRAGAAGDTGFVWTEIAIWVTLAVSILLLISIFGFGGTVGGTVADILIDIFGWVAYLLPFVVFGMVTFLISNHGNGIAYVKTVTCLLFLALVCMFLQLVDEQGGKLGALFMNVLVPAIGIAGTYVVDIILMIICLVIMTGKSALKGVKSQSDKAYDKAKKDVIKHREQAEERRKRKETEREVQEVAGENSRMSRGQSSGRRSDRHVEGVSYNTTISGKSPEMRELKTEPAEKQEDIPLVIHRGEEMNVSGQVDGEDKNARSVMSTAEQPLKNQQIKNLKTGVRQFTEPQAEDFQMERPAEVAQSGDTLAGQAEDLSSDKGLVRKSRTKTDGLGKEIVDVAVAAANAQKPKKIYHMPPLSLLKKGARQSGESDAQLRATAMKLQEILQNFGVNVTVTNVSCGPTVTRYELQPELGVKVSKIVGLSDDIKLNLAAADIRIEAPIPGKAAIGIEVPNKENSAVMLRDLLESAEFKNSASKISFAVGKDIGGKAVVADIAKMPHLLIAGATGSGKSVCINTLIMSILYKAMPDEVKLIMIDPKVVELSVYNGIPHLMIPVVTDTKKAAGALNWAVAEMTRRYQAFADYGVRDIKGYNEKIRVMPPVEGKELEPMPQIVIIVDELADLMMVAPGDVEEAICRLAQLARAAGIHLVLATQRPSVNVITGLIKANMPSRIAFSVSSGVDSRTIIDMNGAEKLLGKGDMLFYPTGYQKPARVQGSFVSDREVQAVVDYLKDQQGETTYDEEIVQQVNTNSVSGISLSGGASEDDGRDIHFAEAGRLIIDKDKASIGMLQRQFKIGFNRAARIMDQLCEAGIVGPEEGTKPRKVLMSPEEFEKYMEENT